MVPIGFKTFSNGTYVITSASNDCTPATTWDESYTDLSHWVPEQEEVERVIFVPPIKPQLKSRLKESVQPKVRKSLIQLGRFAHSAT